MNDRLIDVEYEPSTRADHFRRKTGQIYMGVSTRASDGFTVLKIRAPGATKNHNIEIGQLYAITFNGRRHVLETPHERFKLRAQEISKIVDGKFTEDWATAYFDPESPQYFKRADDYEPQAIPHVDAAFADPLRSTVKQDGAAYRITNAPPQYGIPVTNGSIQPPRGNRFILPALLVAICIAFAAFIF